MRPEELLTHAEGVRKAALDFDVRRLRAAGLTQAEVGRALGIDRSTVSRREARAGSPDFTEARS